MADVAAAGGVMAAATNGGGATTSAAFTESESVVPLTSGGHRHRIKTFSALRKDPTKSVYSNVFMVGGHEWQVVCYPGGETDEVSEFISLFLGYRGPAEHCQATWLLRCVNQKDPSAPRERKWAKGDKYNTFSVGRRWGWQKFIKRENLMDPEKGFLVDDTVIFETEVTVQGTLETSNRLWRPYTRDLGVLIPRRPVPVTTLGDDLLEMYEQQSDLADVEFLFQDDSSLCAHSQILGARSPVFARMFGGGYAESTNIGGGGGMYCIDDSIGQTRGRGVSGVSGGPSGGPSGGADGDGSESVSGDSMLVSVGGRVASPAVSGGGDDDDDDDDVGNGSSGRGGNGNSVGGTGDNDEGVKMSPVGEMSTRAVFRKRRMQQAKERGRKCIEILDIDSEIFDEFLKFMYSGRVDPDLFSQSEIATNSALTNPTATSKSADSGASSASASSTTAVTGALATRNASMSTDDMDPDERAKFEEELDAKRDMVAALMEVADKYETNRLRLMCEHALCDGLSVRNAASTLLVADRHCAEYLKEQCLLFISKNVHEVLESPDAQNLSPDLLKELLKAAVETPFEGGEPGGSDEGGGGSARRGKGGSAFASRKRKLLQRGDNETWQDCVKRLKQQELRQTLMERGMQAVGAREILVAKLAKALHDEEKHGL